MGGFLLIRFDLSCLYGLRAFRDPLLLSMWGEEWVNWGD